MFSSKKSLKNVKMKMIVKVILHLCVLQCLAIQWKSAENIPHCKTTMIISIISIILTAQTLEKKRHKIPKKIPAKLQCHPALIILHNKRPSLPALFFSSHRVQCLKKRFQKYLISEFFVLPISQKPIPKRLIICSHSFHINMRKTHSEKLPALKKGN